jgi:phosphinothricin acetyltransferase
VHGSRLDRFHALRPFGDTNRDSDHPVKVQHLLRYAIGKRFDQLNRVALNDLFNDPVNASIVDRVLHPVASPWPDQVCIHLDIHLEVLGLLTLGWSHAMTPAEHHAVKDNPVHNAIVALHEPGHSAARTGQIDCKDEWNGAGLCRLMPANLTVRPGTDEDLAQLNELYNQYVKDTHFTFDLEPLTIVARREWFSHYGAAGRHRLLVAVLDQAVIGYATSSRFRPKAAYDTSVETSIYLAGESVGKGVGSRLYSELFKLLEHEDVHRAYAGISLPNPASIALHERFGFKRVALFTEQGRKFGRYWDVAWFEKPIGRVPTD